MEMYNVDVSQLCKILTRSCKIFTTSVKYTEVVISTNLQREFITIFIHVLLWTPGPEIKNTVVLTNTDNVGIHTTNNDTTRWRDNIREHVRKILQEFGVLGHTSHNMENRTGVLRHPDGHNLIITQELFHSFFQTAEDLIWEVK